MIVINFSDLEYFNYLCEVKSFTKVAEDLFVSQPSISMSIAKLEKELGVKLISRGSAKKDLVITEAGKVLKEGAIKIISELEDIKFKIKELNNKNIKLGIPPIISLDYIKGLINLDIFKDIDIVQFSSENLIDKFLNNDIDIALIGLLSKIKVIGFDFYNLSEDKFVFCIKKDKFLNCEILDLSNFENEKWIVLDYAFLHKVIFKKLCAKLNIKPKNIIYVKDIKTAMNFLENGIGVGVF